MFRLMLPFGVVMATVLLPSVMPDSLPPAPEGSCRCGMTGDGMVVGYDEGVSSVILESNNFLLSYTTSSQNVYPCDFQFYVRTYTPRNDTQLVLIEGVEISLYQTRYALMFVSRYGIWHNLAPGHWLSDPSNYTDQSIKVTGDEEGGYSIESVESGCTASFYVRIDGVHSKVVAFINREQDGERSGGICGNCNGAIDEYQGLPNDTSPLEAPILLPGQFYIPSLYFPPQPST